MSLPRIAPSRCTGEFNESYLDDPSWVAEPKLDGGRYELYLENRKAYLISRHRFPAVDKADRVPHFAFPYPHLDGVLLDGEVIIERAVRPTFIKVELGETTAILNSAPAEALKRQQEPGRRLFYFPFDILAVNGDVIRDRPLHFRRGCLEEVVHHIRQYTDTVILMPQTQDKAGLFRTMLAGGLEGTVLKNINSPYGVNWVKNKRVSDFSVVVSGYKPGKPGSKYASTLGAVAVSVYKDGKLLEVGFTSGMTDAERDDIWQHRQEYLGRVLDVTAQEVTKDGRLRHPRFLRFRDDVDPQTLTFAKLLDDAKKARRHSKE